MQKTRWQQLIITTMIVAAASGCGTEPTSPYSPPAMGDAKGGKPGGGGGGGGGDGGSAGSPIDLGTLGGKASAARDVNNLGIVVGSANRADGVYAPFVWSEATGMQALPAPEGDATAHPLAMNDAGLIVGRAHAVVNGASVLRAATWRPAGASWTAGLLANLPGYDGTAVANDVNTAGDIVGMNYSAGSVVSAVVVWQLESPRAILNSDPGISYFGSAINDAGWIAGYSKDRTINLNTAMVWVPDMSGSYESGRTILLPRVGAGNNVATAIGNGGVIVGYSGAVGSTVAVRWMPSTDQPTGPGDFSAEQLAGSYANAVNSEGYIAGQEYGNGGWAKPRMWTPAGDRIVLGEVKGHNEPQSINDSRWIVGRGGTRATLWKAP